MSNLTNKNKPSKKEYTLHIILSIFTLGIWPLVWFFVIKPKAKKKAQEVRNELTVDQKLPFSIEQFYNAIGSKQNINTVDATLNSLKVVVNDNSKINQESLKSLGAKGIMKNNNTWTFIFGNFSTTLKQMIEKN